MRELGVRPLGAPICVCGLPAPGWLGMSAVPLWAGWPSDMLGRPPSAEGRGAPMVNSSANSRTDCWRCALSFESARITAAFIFGGTAPPIGTLSNG